MRKTLVISAVGAALVLGGTAAAVASTDRTGPAPAPSASTSAGVAPNTSEADARKIATDSVPGSRVTETDLETENGHPAWKFHLSTADARYEVYVDSADGRILKTERDDDSRQSAPAASTTVPTTPRAVVPDDHGRDDVSRGGSDDGPGHDLYDDHGGDRPDSNDDHGRR
jgi:uncharacterized membrane protein YkoI